MSKDIRSYFISSKSPTAPASKTVVEDNKSKRKKAKAVITSDDDEFDDKNTTTTKKGKKTKATEKINGNKTTTPRDNKKHSKKRTIISSDEDEANDDAIHAKSKKVKLMSNGKKTNDNDESLEVVEDLGNVFNKKTVERVNAKKVVKKTKEPVVKKSTSKSKTEFMNEDDEFEATLNQLDTSKIEDEYLSTVTSAKKDKDKSDSEKKSKDNKNEKADKKSPSPTKNKTKEKEQKDQKHESNKDKKKKEQLDIKVEKETKSPKVNKKTNDVDYNDIIEEKIEKKKQHAILYQHYLHRGGARNPGSKEIPEAAEQCFANLSFLITGVLDALEREEVEEVIKRYGGKILHSVSKKLNYMIVGDEPGPSKMAKAESLNIKKLTEDDFLDLLRSHPPTAGSKKSSISPDNKRKRENGIDHDDKKITEEAKKVKEESVTKSPEKEESPKKDLKSKDEQKSSKKNKVIEESPSKNEAKSSKPSPVKTDTSEPSTSKMENKNSESSGSSCTEDGGDHLTALVEKYRPKELKQIIGQTGDKSNAKKLLNWLTNWHKHHGKNAKAPKPKFSYRDDTGTIYKAALLSGPPGIGKTTTAYVICAQLGYEVLEFNASDTRSKKLLQDEIQGILSNKTVKSLFTNIPDKKQEKKNDNAKHVLLMDEVDGMAGNEDRGGMQELISFIKATEVPIICICNDRNSQKIKTLANYTFDLRFPKPRLEQIRAAMMSLCFKEGIKITPEELTFIIQSTNQDIRQVINQIAMLSAKPKTKDADSTDSKEPEKHMNFKNTKLGPWDVVRKVFSASDHKTMSIHDKSDLFFHDYSIAPLFVEENYLIVTPNGPKNEVLKKLADCTESLVYGDLIENKIRSNQAWSLLPIQACFSSVIPGTVMSGFINSQINFPSWLGKNSKRNKCDRLLQDVTTHAHITTGASKEAINLDYIKMLVDSIVRPLAEDGLDGVEEAVVVMNKYHLSREDLDALIELTKWPHTRDPMQSVDSKTKTAFTKAYNKSSHYCVQGTMKKKSSRRNGDDDWGSDMDDNYSDNDDDDKVENDNLIKTKTSKAKKDKDPDFKLVKKTNTKKTTAKTAKKK